MALAEPFEFALDAIRKFFFNLKLIRECFVAVLDPRHVLIKLINDLNYNSVFSHRSYFVSNCYMKLFKWSSFFDITVESSIILIWVSLPNLRPHMFSPRILHGLGTLFCLPLKTDNAAVVGSRSPVARILIELDISKSYPEYVWNGPDNLGYIEQVVMKDFPPFYDHYKSLGHCKNNCSILHPHSHRLLRLFLNLMLLLNGFLRMCMLRIHLRFIIL
ncbi:hypothetical protein M5K25_025146 [Dendrobium thyrsiflorum]|uniref:DUF4283 domain-containing protein n=1 Tax=Dendrobium thyrsiflorum TaxID=117978 RepID=A0ABD0U3W0_DENTH